MKRKCKSFALDIMHLSANEVDQIKDLTALKAHIKDCPDCREKLGKLSNTDVFAFLSKPRSQGYQAKMKKLVQRVKSESEALPLQPLPGSTIDVHQKIVSAADKVYNCIRVNGPIMPITLLRQKANLWDFPFYESIGLLTAQGRISVTENKKDAKIRYVSLKPPPNSQVQSRV